jgi:hypothetical protein
MSGPLAAFISTTPLSCPVRLNLRGEGLPVDVKSGPSTYVVGPLSQRPDGGSTGP